MLVSLQCTTGPETEIKCIFYYVFVSWADLGIILFLYIIVATSAELHSLQ